MSVAFMAASGFLLFMAQKNIPIGTAYAVWMDTVWLECKDLLARWQKGDVDLETFDDVKVYLTAPPSLK